MKEHKGIIVFLIGILLIIVGVSIGGMNQLNFHFIARPHLEEDIHYQIPAHQEDWDLKMEVSYINVEVKERDIPYIEINATNVYRGLDIQYDHHEISIEQPHYLRTHNHPTKVLIYVPTGFQFDQVEIESSLGQTNISGIHAKTMDVDNLLGQTNMRKCIVDSINVDNLLGQTNLSQLTSQDVLSVDSMLGNINVQLDHSIDDFERYIDVFFGSYRVNDYHYSGFSSEETNNHNNHKLEIDCGFSSINIQEGGNYE